MDGAGAVDLRMTEDEKARLAKDGFVVREGAFGAADRDAIGAACDALVARVLAETRETKHVVGSYMFERQAELKLNVKWEPDDPELLQGLEPFAHLSEDLERWTRDPRFTDPCKAIIGADEVCLFTEKLNLKRARRGGKYILHQDFPYWEAFTPVAANVATAMLFLDDATKANGCLEVAPGSHTSGKFKRRSDDVFHSLEMDVDAFDTGRLIHVEVPAGSVIYFGSFLVHRSAPNRSDHDRRALLFSYQPAGHPHARDMPRKRRWWEDSVVRDAAAKD